MNIFTIKIFFVENSSNLQEIIFNLKMIIFWGAFYDGKRIEFLKKQKASTKFIFYK